MGLDANWSVALSVAIVALACKFYSRGFISNAAVLIDIIAVYFLAYALGLVRFGKVASAS